MDLQKIRDWFDSEEGQKSIAEFADKLYKEEEIKTKQLERKFEQFTEKVIKKYNSCYKARMQHLFIKDMKEQILKIAEKLRLELITEDKARNLLLDLFDVSGSSKIDVYECLKAEMMATTDITLDEFEEVLQMWISIKKKELSIAEFEKNYR